MKTIVTVLVTAVLAAPMTACADTEVNVYTSRKEALIRPLLDQFTAATGIEVRVLSASDGALLTRLQNEGANTQADLLLTVDAGNLHRAKEAGVLRALASPTLDAAIPQTHRDPEGYWYGLSQRARVIYRAVDRVAPDAINSYADLTDPEWRGKICIRSSGNIYNQSLVASMIETRGVEETEQWAAGLVANFARPPQGGDTDQLKALAAGQCDVAVANSYYFARLLADESQSSVTDEIALIWPDQDGRGAHVNVSGAGITTHAKHAAEAQQLLEFLAGSDAQAWYAEANHEFPVRPGVPASEILASWGEFRSDEINLSQLGVHNADAVKLMDRVGWR